MKKAVALILIVSISLVVSAKEGRVETLEDGNWVTTCSEGFSDTEAKTVCRQLGLEGGTGKVVKSASNKNRSTTGFKCAAGDTTTEQCNRKAWIDNFLAPNKGNAGIPVDSAGKPYHTWQVDMGSYDQDSAVNLCQYVPGCIGVANEKPTIRIKFRSGICVHGWRRGLMNWSQVNKDPVKFKNHVATRPVRIRSGQCERQGVDLSRYTNTKVCAGRRRQSWIAQHFTIEFTEIASTEWQFRFKVDFGGGGVVQMDDVIKSSSTTGLGTSSTGLDYKQTLAAGAHKMEIFGQEPCCDGASSIQFNRGGKGWKGMNAKNLEKAISNSGKDKIGTKNWTFFIDSTYSLPKAVPENAVSITVSKTGTGKGAPSKQKKETVNGVDGKDLETYVLGNMDLMNTCARTDFDEQTDGTAASYKNWATGEPKTGDYVAMNKDGKWVTTDSTTLYDTTVCESAPGTYRVDDFGKVNWGSSNSKCNSGSGSIATPKSADHNTKVNAALGDGKATPIGLKRQNFSSYCASKCGHDKDAGVKCDDRTLTSAFGNGFVRITNETTSAVQQSQLDFGEFTIDHFTMTDRMDENKGEDGNLKRFIEINADAFIQNVGPDESFHASFDIESLRDGKQQEILFDGDGGSQHKAQKKWSLQLNDSKLFKDCDIDKDANTMCEKDKRKGGCWIDKDGTVNEKKHYFCIVSMQFKAMGKNAIEFSQVWSYKVQFASIKKQTNTFDMLHRNVAISVRGLPVSAARYIKCGPPNAETVVPRKVGGKHITTCSWEAKLITQPTVMTWQQEDTTDCPASSSKCRYNHINGDGASLTVDKAANKLVFTSFQQQKGQGLKHMIILKAKTTTRVRLMKELESHRRLAGNKEGLEDKEGAWSVDQPIQGNICGEEADAGDCQDAIPDAPKCGEGLTENKYGECEGSFFFMLFGLISMIML